jgi:hypothetical protein
MEECGNFLRERERREKLYEKKSPQSENNRLIINRLLKVID